MPLALFRQGLQKLRVHNRLVGKGPRLVGLAPGEPARTGGLVRPWRVSVDASLVREALVVGHLREHPLQVGALVEAVELGGDDDRVDGGGHLCAPGRVGEEPVLSAMCQRT